MGFSVCHCGQPVHGVFWRTGPSDSTGETQRVEAVCGQQLLMKTDSVKRILNHLNGVCPTIQFTFKFEKNSSLPFLDAHLTQSQHHNGIDTESPPHDQYLGFLSHYPIHIKRGLVRCLDDRANSVKTSQSNLQWNSSTSRAEWLPFLILLVSSQPPPCEPIDNDVDNPPIVSIP